MSRQTKKFRFRVEQFGKRRIRIVGDVDGRSVTGELTRAMARQLGANLVNVADDVELLTITGTLDVEVGQ